MRWLVVLLAACAFDPSGLPPQAHDDAGTVDVADAPPALIDAAPADAELLMPDAEPPDADPPDACVDITCNEQGDCTVPFTCCYNGVCAEGNFHSGLCWPADDWLPCL